MPRVGQSPMKWLEGQQQPERVTITTVVHIPNLEGYWAESFDVLQLCFNSILNNTDHPFDFMVLDNGSCEEVQDYLLSVYKKRQIQYLILSQYNLRKLRAVNFLLSVAPGEVISFTDSDVYFHRGWLDATLEILEAFPEAGQVTALPTADRAREYCSATFEQIEGSTDVSIQRGNNLIPEEFIHAHAISLGIPPDEYTKNRLKNRLDTLISRGGISAFVSAQDFQFTTTRRAVRGILPIDNVQHNEYYDPVYSPVLESRLNENGFWRLSTTKYYAHHLGNKVPNETELKNIFGNIDSQSIRRKETHRVDSRRILLNNRYIRSVLKKINILTYRLLYE